MDLLACFERGLIPGPDESEEAFLTRVKKAIPLNHSEWVDASQKTRCSFGFSIDWVPLEYSNRKMAWWEGAVTWITDDTLPFIQLRKKFKRGFFLGYKRADILAHEAVHAARMRFEEPEFEEMFAYRLAPEKWKRFLGPLFSRPWETILLILSLSVWIIFPWISIGVFGAGVSRLCWRHWIFRRCLKKVSLSFAFCLTDQEIKAIALRGEDVLKTMAPFRAKLLSHLLHMK